MQGQIWFVISEYSVLLGCDAVIRYSSTVSTLKCGRQSYRIDLVKFTYLPCRSRQYVQPKHRTRQNESKGGFSLPVEPRLQGSSAPVIAGGGEPTGNYCVSFFYIKRSTSVYSDTKRKKIRLSIHRMLCMSTNKYS